MLYSYTVIRSRRKSIGLEVTKEGTLIVRAPYRLRKTDIQNFVEKKSEWIESHMNKVKEYQSKLHTVEKLSQEELDELYQRAKDIIPERVAHYASQMRVSYGRITIRCQKTRWGSCSQKGNLNFNCLLMLTPPEILDYVVVHELCHRLEMNHSERFWAEVEKVLPNYKEAKRWLKQNGNILMVRVW